MKVTCGDTHQYLGMKIHFSHKSVIVSMMEYVEDMVSDFQKS